MVDGDTARSAGRRGVIRGLASYWANRSLAQQFAVVAAIVVVAGMVALGAWVGQRIKQGVMHNSAASGALFMDGYIVPLVQELATGEEISPQKRSALDRVLRHAAISNRVAAIKIWRTDGVVAYSNWPELIGKSFPQTENFRRALRGIISAEFEGQYHEPDARERQLQGPLLEIYAPVRAIGSDRIIAISEFYKSGAELKSELASAEHLTWFVVALVTAAMVAALSGIVARGSRTIDSQRRRLETQVAELSRLLSENAELNERVQRASARTAIINDKLLRRVGADLHDGPAQHLSLALLRLDGLAPLAEVFEGAPARGGGSDPNAQADPALDLERIRSSLSDAMRELREISAGLALPELGRATLGEAVSLAVRAHERKTDTHVGMDLGDLPREVPDEVKTCVYRFVQEGLNNAFRHAGGRGQKVRAGSEGHWIQVSVSDEGPGFQPSGRAAKRAALGLSGMRDRIECLGGILEAGPATGGGVELVARFDLERLRRTDSKDA